jgi:hypothetical protein
MKITIKELRQLVKSVISENLGFDGSEYSYEESDSFVKEFELNGNDFEVVGKDYGDGDIEIETILIYTGDEENGIIDGMEISDEEMLEYSGYNRAEFEDYVIDLIEN